MNGFNPIHPLARKSVIELELPQPLSYYRAGITEKLSTNPFGGNFAQYPNPYPVDVQIAYAASLFRLHDAPVNPESILFTAGSGLGIECLIRAFCDPRKDSLCICPPTFPAYEHFARICDVPIVKVPLEGAHYNKLNFEKILAAQSKLTILCSPGNPTGTRLDHDHVLTLVRNTKGLIVIDEAYAEFSREKSFLKFMADHPNLVILRTFSKAWGLAGIRAGAIIANGSILNAIRVVQDPYSCSMNAQFYILEKVNRLDAMIAEIELIKQMRNKMVDEMIDLNIVEKVIPSDTNFLIIKLKRYTADSDILLFWSKALVIHIPHLIKNAIRVSIGTEEENLESVKFVSALR